MPLKMAQSRGSCQKSLIMENLIRYWTTEIRKIAGEKVVLHIQIDEVNSYWAYGKE